SYQPSPSSFINHIGKVLQKEVSCAEGEAEHWLAMWIEDHNVNTWSLCHGADMASFDEMGTAAAACVPGGPPVLGSEMSMQFIKAPKLGQLLEVCGTCTRRTRSIVFTSCRAYADGELVFTATSVQKVIAAAPG